MKTVSLQVNNHIFEFSPVKESDRLIIAKGILAHAADPSEKLDLAVILTLFKASLKSVKTIDGQAVPLTLDVGNEVCNTDVKDLIKREPTVLAELSRISGELVFGSTTPNPSQWN